MIPYAKQNINKNDIKTVLDVLKSDWLTQGPMVPKFENSICKYVSIEHCIAVNSATSALHIACLALGLGRGHIAWTVANSFVASANCALYCGSDIDFVDIDSRTYNISLISLEEKLIKAKKVNRLPKVLICVHFAGQSPEMKKIFELSKEYGFKIIEDASHSIGSKYLNKLVGSCTYSDITVFSFHPVKIITTGEGGVALTNNNKLAEKMRSLRVHGITNAISKIKDSPSSEIWNYQQIDLGFNYRMSDIHAALGLSQMQRIDQFISKRKKIAGLYFEKLKNLPIKLPWQHPDADSSFHLFPVRVLNKKNNKQKSIYKKLQSLGIGVNLHYIPIYLQPYYMKKGFKRGYCPESEKYFSEVISLPIFPDLESSKQIFIIDTLFNIFNENIDINYDK